MCRPGDSMLTSPHRTADPSGELPALASHSGHRSCAGFPRPWARGTLWELRKSLGGQAWRGWATRVFPGSLGLSPGGGPAASKRVLAWASREVLLLCLLGAALLTSRKPLDSQAHRWPASHRNPAL